MEPYYRMKNHENPTRMLAALQSLTEPKGTIFYNISLLFRAKDSRKLSAYTFDPVLNAFYCKLLKSWRDINLEQTLVWVKTKTFIRVSEQ